MADQPSHRKRLAEVWRTPTVEELKAALVTQFSPDQIEAFNRALPDLARKAERFQEQIDSTRLMRSVQSVRALAPAPVQNTEPVRNTEPTQPVAPAAVPDTQPVRPVAPLPEQNTEPMQPVAPAQEKFANAGFFRMLDSMPTEEVYQPDNNIKLAKQWMNQGGRGGLRYLRGLAGVYKRTPRKK